MTYSQQDVLQKIKATLPTRWFGESTPVLDSVLNALAVGWVGLLNLLDYVTLQSRIGTATDDWLDLVALDFFGSRVQRRLQETDNAFRHRVSAELLRDRCTRAAVYDVLVELTGRSPLIFEPTNPQDTGCYYDSVLGCAAYGISGGWGTLNLPFQAFVRAFRPIPAGVAMLNGWNGIMGGFGAGFAAYASSDINSSGVGDSEIYETVARTAAVGTIVWMSIEP